MLEFGRQAWQPGGPGERPRGRAETVRKPGVTAATHAAAAFLAAIAASFAGTWRAPPAGSPVDPVAFAQDFTVVDVVGAAALAHRVDDLQHPRDALRRLHRRRPPSGAPHLRRPALGDPVKKVIE
eukprot:gene7299-biopygen4127